MPKTGPQLHDAVYEQKRVFDAIARSSVDSSNVLVLGPSTSKMLFVEAVQHERALEPKVVWLEAADAQLVAPYEDRLDTSASPEHLDDGQV